MIFPEVSLEQFQLLRADRIQWYLEAHQWKQQRCEPARHSVWSYRTENGEEFVLLLPLSVECPDFADRMYDLARVLALVEQRYLVDVFKRLKQVSDGQDIVSDPVLSSGSIVEIAILEKVREMPVEQQRQILAFVEFLSSQDNRFSPVREAG